MHTKQKQTCHWYKSQNQQDGNVFSHVPIGNFPTYLFTFLVAQQNSSQYPLTQTRLKHLSQQVYCFSKTSQNTVFNLGGSN